jgi:uncharacterized protein (DUF1810 family)
LRAGTFAPFSRASLRPIAIACLRLFTFRPEPLVSVPFFLRRIADRTDFDAPRPYFAIRSSCARHLQVPCWTWRRRRVTIRTVEVIVKSNLDRFKEAQDQPGAGFDSALAEIRAGRKRGHWIWYVFPQLSGLGSSPMSGVYGIDGEREAVEYLSDPELRSRLVTITEAVAERLREGKSLPLDTLMGSHIDALKLVSSLTLFGHLARTLHGSGGGEELERLARLADEVLAAAGRMGYPRCSYTLSRLA